MGAIQPWERFQGSGLQFVRGSKVHDTACASCLGPNTYKQADPSFSSHIRVHDLKPKETDKDQLP